MARLAAALAVLWIVACSGAPVTAQAAAHGASRPNAATAALVAEVRRTFKVHGKPIPPEIFRDFGDGDLADSGNHMGHGERRGRDRQQPLFR